MFDETSNGFAVNIPNLLTVKGNINGSVGISQNLDADQIVSISSAEIIRNLRIVREINDGSVDIFRTLKADQKVSISSAEILRNLLSV